MWGVIPVDNNKLKEPIRDVASLPKSSTLLKGMATCHSLTIINDELLGDPLDVKVSKLIKIYLTSQIKKYSLGF